MEQTEPTEHRKRSLVFPLLLIGAGIIFLLSNLGFVTGNFWDLVFRYWPVLLILGGLDSIYRREGLFGPVFLVGLGTVLLLLNLGYLSWEIWSIAFRYWPALIILAGVSVILHRYLVTWWGALVTLLIVLGVVAGIVWYAGQRQVTGTLLPTAEVTQPLGSAKQAVVTISPAVGNILIHNTKVEGALISGRAQTASDEQIDQQNLSQGDTAIYTIHSQGIWRTMNFGSDAPVTWDLGITEKVPVDLTFEMGAGQANLDLSKLTLSHLKINSAVGSIRVTLPENGPFDGEINGAVGSLTVYVPPQLNVQIHATGGLHSMDVPPQFSRSGDDISSVDASGPVATLTVSQAIGNLVIKPLQ